MSNGSKFKTRDLSKELARKTGIGSNLGDLAISYLEERLYRVSDRSSLINEWQKSIGPGGNPRNVTAMKIKGAKLSGNEMLFCLQVYYAIVVLFVAWNYLTRECATNHKELELDLLTNGKAFEPMGLANLRLEGCPSGFGMGIEGVPYPLSHLLQSITELDLREHEKGDLFRPLYENLFPAKLRHALGEHYTPEWLVSHMLDKVGFRGQEGETLIDPACGSGVFLVEALSRKRSHNGSVMDFGTLVGIDVNPLAVLAAKVNYLIAAGYQNHSSHERVEIPVYLYDIILSDDNGLWSEPNPWGDAKFDFVVGNPPWINWESLSSQYRQATLEHWRKYGLFSHSGMDTILGKGKKDFSTLMTLSSAKQFLKINGKMAFLITQGVFKSGGAAEGFRSFSLPDGTKLKVLLVEDLSRCRPFAGTSNRTAVLYLEKGRPTEYPIAYDLWTGLSNDNAEPKKMHQEVLDLVAEPANLAKINSPWLTCRDSCREGLRKILGTSKYRGREGANTGGANGILWVEVIDRPQPGLVRIRNLANSSRKKIPVIEVIIEDNLIYPLLKGVDVARWQANPSAHIIMTQDPLTRRGISQMIMARNYPRTLAYLKRFEPELINRAAYRRYFKKTDPFYSMFNVGEYTLAPYKTVWHRFGNRMKTAVVEGIDRPVIPQETHTMVACQSREEAWYLAGLLNSLPVEYAISSYSMVGGKSFAGPNLFSFISIPLYTGSQAQKYIAEVAYKVATGGGSDSLLTDAVARFYEISFSQLEAMKNGWEELGLGPI